MEKKTGLVINNCYKAESICQELVHLFLLASTREGDIIPALQMWKLRKWPLSRDSQENIFTAAKSLQSCPTLCDPIDRSPPGSRPWDSPGKSNGEGCHCLLQCRKVKSESEVAQSCPTLRDPVDCSPPGSSVHGILQARVLEWGAIAFSSVQFSSVTQSCPTLCDPMNRSTPGLTVHHQLPEFTQTHVY